ncbi:hypothetical protein FLSI110296_06195 [Flavobacterium sinopsychrotolerans]|nr:hypothetical protein [Flavobacterium sinopsychrotolerans]
MAFLVICTIFLILKGSSELNNLGKEKEVDRALNATQKRVPWGVKKVDEIPQFKNISSPLCCY